MDPRFLDLDAVVIANLLQIRFRPALHPVTIYQLFGTVGHRKCSKSLQGTVYSSRKPLRSIHLASLLRTDYPLKCASWQPKPSFSERFEITIDKNVGLSRRGRFVEHADSRIFRCNRLGRVPNRSNSTQRASGLATKRYHRWSGSLGLCLS